MEGNKVLKVLLISFASLFCISLLVGGVIMLFRTEKSESVTPDYTTISNSMSSVSPKYEDLTGLNNELYETSSDMSEESVDSSVIRVGSMSIEVENIDNTLSEISAINTEFGATILNSYDNGEDNERVASLTIQVEEEKFDEMYSKLKEIDGDFVYSSVNSTDVTEVVADLNARLTTYQSVEAQLLEILKTATTVTDTLAVYKELSDIRYQIESVQTQLDDMSEQTDYSTIYISLSLSDTGIAISEDEWKPVGVFKTALNTLVSFAKSTGSALIWVLVFSPVLALFVVVAKLVYKKIAKDRLE